MFVSGKGDFVSQCKIFMVSHIVSKGADSRGINICS